MIDDLRAAVEELNDLSADAQVTVSHRAWSAELGWGDDSLAAAVSRQAFVFNVVEDVRTSDGQKARAHHRILFLGNVVVNQKDQLTLPGGETGHVLTVDGIKDPDGGVLFIVATMG